MVLGNISERTDTARRSDTAFSPQLRALIVVRLVRQGRHRDSAKSLPGSALKRPPVESLVHWKRWSFGSHFTALFWCGHERANTYT